MAMNVLKALLGAAWGAPCSRKSKAQAGPAALRCSPAWSCWRMLRGQLSSGC